MKRTVFSTALAVIAALLFANLYLQAQPKSPQRFHQWRSEDLSGGNYAILVNDSVAGKCYLFIDSYRAATSLQPVPCE